VNPAEEKRDSWTQSDSDKDRRRCEASLVGPDQRTAKEPFGRYVVLQLYGNCGTAIGHDADRGAALCRDNPEASHEWLQTTGCFVKSNIGAIDERAANAHASDEMATPAGERQA
jgi:hypothetical protein